MKPADARSTTQICAWHEYVNMTEGRSTRREFLQRGSALVAAGGGLGAFEGVARGDDAANGTSQRGARHAVACSRREAAAAARVILHDGGNAMDAAIAALLVQCVIEPSMVGLGGYGGSLVYYQAKTGCVEAIDFDARAPRRFDPATFTEAAGMRGYLAIATPGVVAGIDLALERFGSLPFKTLAAPALDLAANGFPVTPKLAASFAGLLKSIDPVSRRAFFPDGVPEVGTDWSNADLAQLIQKLSDEGPGSFYRGEIPRAIARQVRAHGGVLAADDFDGFQATLVKPLHIKYRGYDLYTPPLPSGGLSALSILKTLEQFDLASLPAWGADYVALFAGASNLAWQERFQYFGDPDFVSVPVDELLSTEKATERAAQLRQGKASATSPPDHSSHTVNLLVADDQRNIVSLTATHGGDFGAHVAIEGWGLMLGHGMSRFSATPGDPNYPAPRKRPQHNMSPLLVMKDGRPYAALGLPGGRFIVTVTAQLAVNLIDFKAAPQEIVSAPRIHTEGSESIQVTSSIEPHVVEQLCERGHAVEVKPSIGAGANAILVDPETGDLQAAATQGSSGASVF